MKSTLYSLSRSGLWLVPVLVAACSKGGGGQSTYDAAKVDAIVLSAEAGARDQTSSDAVVPSPDASPDSAPRTPDASPDSGPRTPDVSPETAPGSPDTGPDTSPGDASSVFIPPMPSVASDPTLMDTTDFGTSTGFKIILDYRNDTDQYFTRERRLVLRTAAASWEQFIASDFTPIPAGTYVRARDPQNPDAGGSNFTVSYPIDDLVIFVGSAAIDGSGSTLAVAYSSNTAQGMTADLAATLSQRYTGNPYQPWVATIAVDKEESFFFDSTMDTADDIPLTQEDFYSTVLHEMGHVLGIGQCSAYLALVSNDTFTGAKAVGVYGAPIPLASDGRHVSKTVIVDGRRVVMDESDAPGQRSLITRLDLAMIEDLGYQIRR
jgi:hypothetical protein